jgi:hypothetical protein
VANVQVASKTAIAKLQHAAEMYRTAAIDVDEFLAEVAGDIAIHAKAQDRDFANALSKMLMGLVF